MLETNKLIDPNLQRILLSLVENSVLKEHIVSGYNEFNYASKLFRMIEGKNELIENEPSGSELYSLVTQVSNVIDVELSRKDPWFAVKGDKFLISATIPPILVGQDLAFRLCFISI